MKRWWLSWHQPTEDYRPLAYPPNSAVLGWWCTGESQLSVEDDAWNICAMVEAESEDGAKAAVKVDWPEAFLWRFCAAKPLDYVPGDRFPLAPWMKGRFGVKE